VIEIDAASNTGVDNIRELIERSRFAPVQARWKVYVVDECHMLSTAAFNALLKTLEEPPPRVVFVLATTDPQRVLPTILSRCQRFDFRRIPLEALQGHLRWIAAQEDIGISEEALHVVAQRAQGGLRDAESLLDQLSLLPAPIEAEAVWELLGAVPEQDLLDLAEALAASDPLAVVESCRRLLERGREPTALLQGLAGILRDLLLAGVAPDRLELTSVAPGLRPALPELARRIGRTRLVHWQAQLKGCEQQLRLSVQPRLWLEVLLLGLLAEAAPALQAPAPVAQAPVAVASVAPAPVPAPAPRLPAPPAPDSAAPAAATSVDLAELWQQILAGLELPSTRMLLNQQAQLVRLDERRAVVRVAGTWMAMVQSRLPLLEKALAGALGSPRQLVLEAGGGGGPGESPSRTAAAPMAALPAAAAVLKPEPPAPATAVVEAPAKEPTAAAPAAAPASAAQATLAHGTEEAATTPDAVAANDRRAQPSALDEKARRLADFFNGEVISDWDDDAA
jgi:DNA polymerase-3 subunit gamma/tau